MPDSYTTRKGQLRWRARWRTGSGERHTKRGFRTEGDARAYEEAMRTDRRRGEPLRPPRTRMSVDDYWRRWWQQEVVIAKARGTQYGYRAVYNAYIAPGIGQVRLRELVEDPQLLTRWRASLATTRSDAVVVQAQRVLSSMLSAAAEEELIPHNPLLLLERTRRRGRIRKVARPVAPREPVAIDPAAWFLMLDYLRRPSRPGRGGKELRYRRYPLDRERDALIIALGFMAGLRLPSEVLGLTFEDVRRRRLHIEGRSSAGEYIAGSKTGRGRDLPLVPELASELRRVKSAYEDAGQPLAPGEFWIQARDGAIWSEHQAHNWRARDFRPVAGSVAADFPQFAALATATPYQCRHTFVSCCLQAGVSLATIAAWCGTSIQMISGTYGRVIRRLEGEAPVELFLQYRTAKVQAMTLLSGNPRRSKTEPQGGSTGAVFDRSWTQGGSTGGSTVVKMPRSSSRKRAD